ncbi:MAG TPA: site-specific integrase [Burkholderiaceae bacterium]
MSIRQRNGIWWVDLRTPSGKRIRQSTGTKDRKAAQEYNDKVASELWRIDRLSDQPEHTYDAAAVRFLNASEGQKDYRTKLRHVIYWRQFLGGRPVSSFTTETIMDALLTHVSFRRKGKMKLSAATRNRYLSTIRRILNLCVEWKWLSTAPCLRPLGEPSVRIRWITQDKANALIAAIPRTWMKDACAFALATGMRAGEILSLEFAQVDLARRMAWITAARAKSGKSRPVPLNDEAIDILQRRKGTHETLAFTSNGKPQKQIDPKMFGRACAKAGIEDFRFHDLRHTWASWHVQAGTPLFVLKELGGWETLEMVKKSAHLNPGHLAQYADAVTFWAQQPEKAKTPPARVALVA